MGTIHALGLDHRQINEQIRTLCCNGREPVMIDGCLGQRFIANGMTDCRIVISGTPGNALGAYLNGATLSVYGNAQDATGDTMNAGEIVIHGSTGDAAGYAMRGGAIYVRDDAGYRAGIHMKAYHETTPALIIGGRAGSFLGEYQAGGDIVLLGLGCDDDVFGYFCGTGMHGGRIFVRCAELQKSLPAQVRAVPADEASLRSIEPYLRRYEALFNRKIPLDDGKRFFLLTPNTQNPYHQLYVAN